MRNPDSLYWVYNVVSVILVWPFDTIPGMTDTHAHTQTNDDGIYTALAYSVAR